ncbi:hypothetical protein JST99_00315 [Candidatus Dependentiae bacterium]|nr:hypothetical protein [Candidatus Dependentiae bacterium]MCC7415454.1 hypothetical protein [Campylobacterota bacterium]
MKTKNMFLKIAMLASVLLLTPRATHSYDAKMVMFGAKVYLGLTVAVTTVFNTFIGSSAYWLYSGRTSQPALALAAISGSILAYSTYKLTQNRSHDGCKE